MVLLARPCLWAQHPQTVTAIPVVASVVPAQAPPLLHLISEHHFKLSTPIRRQGPHSLVSLPEPCRVPYLLQHTNRGQRKPMFGVLHCRVRAPFRTMVSFRDRLDQAVGKLLTELPLLDPSQFQSLGIQLMHHPHTWPNRETNIKFHCYETYISSSHTAVRTRKAYTFRAGNDRC